MWALERLRNLLSTPGAFVALSSLLISESQDASNLPSSAVSPARLIHGNQKLFHFVQEYVKYNANFRLRRFQSLHIGKTPEKPS